MNARTVFTIALTALIAGTAGYFVATKSALGAPASPRGTSVTQRKIKFYQSPMHPWIKSEKPGKCTICGMDLVPVYEGEAGIETKGNLVSLTPATASVIGVQTSEVHRGALVRTLRVTGVVNNDDTRYRYVSSYTDVRLEKLFVNQVGQEFAAGELLALVYSPELLQARQNFHTLAHAPVESPLTAPAREKLLRLGLMDTQIDELAKAATVTRETEILARTGGSVLERNAFEGGYVKAGDRILTIADFSTMWFVFDAYEADLAWMRVGQPVEVTLPSRPGETLTAPIAFIDPNLNEMTRTARVRVVLDNADRKLLHRATATGRVRAENPGALLVLRSAVLHTQARPLVYVDKGGGTYEPRAIELDRVGDSDYAVRSGLRDGEHVVTEGALLLDGQAQLAHSASGEHEPTDMGPMPAASAATTTRNDIDALKPLVFAAADAADALSGDDLDRYQKLLPTLQAALTTYVATFPDAAKGPLAQFTEGLKPGADLKTTRRSFETFSTAIADLARDAHLHHSGAVKIYQCPMSPALGTGRWLQRGAPMRNPFFGSAMPDCGEEIK